MQGPAWRTVAGSSVPSSRNSWVIPTFFPMIPVTIFLYPGLLAVFLAERLDLDVDAGRQIQLHQRINRLRRRLEDVDQALVRAHFELLARLLVDVRRAQHRPLVDFRRQRNGTRKARTGALG